MNKKLLLTIITMFLLLAGFGKTLSTNTAQQNGQTKEEQQSEESITDKQNDQCTITTSDTSHTSDCSQYVNKVWVVKDGIDNSSYNFPSFRISEIVNGEITGKISKSGTAVLSPYYYLPNHYEDITGAIDKGTGECQFSDEKGNKGNIKLVFKLNGEIEGTIKYT